MKDITYIEKYIGKEVEAKGKFIIEIVDPTTKKIKERIEQKNHVFKDALFIKDGSSSWIDCLNEIQLVMTDSDYEIDYDFPFLLGDVVGYGMPNNESYGLYRGAYNKNTQVLAKQVPNGLSWKYEYNFNTNQANLLPIRTIGLTHQYRNKTYQHFNSAYMNKPNNNNNIFSTNVGIFAYGIDNNGIIYKCNIYAEENSTSDISNLFQVKNTQNKLMGYDYDNEELFVLHYESSGKIMLYKINSSLDSLESPIEIRACNDTYNKKQGIIYNNTLYIVGYDNKIVYYPDWKNIKDATVLNLTSKINPISESYVNNMAYLCNYVSRKGMLIGDSVIFDLNKNKSVGSVFSLANKASDSSNFKCNYPIGTKNKLPCFFSFSYGRNMLLSTAVTAQKLENPIQKTDQNALNVIYELEVNF